MRSGNNWIIAALAIAPLGACGMIDGREEALARPAAANPPDKADGRQPDAPMAPEGPASVGPAAISARLDAAPASDDHMVLGDPYMVDGKTYTPANLPSLDEVGYAALLSDAAQGRRTANGEPYMASAITAAHPTLPLPSYVEVTAIATGRTILVRVNDRGPMLNDRIIALSPGAARQLGIATDGTAGVRVRKVNPIEQDRRMLRGGGQVAERLEAPPGLRAALAKMLPASPVPITGPVRTASMRPAIAVPRPARPVRTAPIPASPPPASAAPTLATQDTDVVHSDEGAPETRIVRPVRTPPAPAAVPKPASSPRPAAARPEPPPETPVQTGPGTRRGGYVVQVAALSSRARADALARTLGGFVTPAGALFRVRTGPFATEASARSALRPIHAKGYAEARVVVNDAR